MGKVILIGGSPMSGKSTVAIEIASILKCQCISTDDIGESLQTVAPINPMREKNYIDYYADTQPSKLILDIQKYHEALKPAISRLIEIHSTWGSSIVIEGWALYPSHIEQFKNDNVSTFWLIADKSLLFSRINNKPSFLNGIAANNFLYRSKWHNNLLFEQCKKFDSKYILIHGNETPIELARQILNFNKSF